MKTQNRISISTIFIALFLGGILVFWSFQVSGQDLNAAQKEVWETEKAGWEHLRQGDMAAFMGGLHEEALIWWRNKKIPLDKTTMEYNYKGWLDYDKLVSYDLTPLSIHIFGNLANVYFAYKWNGNILSDHGRIIHTYVRQGNKWLLIGSVAASCEKPLYCE